MLKERISKHLNKPYIYLPDVKKFLCSNGVLFTLDEYYKGIDINAEYVRREKEDMLYDYAYAKSTGVLRKKRGYQTPQTDSHKNAQEVSESHEEVQANGSSENLSEWNSGSNINESVQRGVSSSSRMDKRREDKEGQSADFGRRHDNTTDRPETERKPDSSAVKFIIPLLAFTSIISMYISTLHTATYLRDYVDMFSAWLMSSSVTAYNATAFEVSVLFHKTKRNFMSFVFMSLWVMVTLFSMATTVSIFYDQFNFQETQIAQENRELDSNKLALELLQKKEKDLREAIEFKKKDIEYRQEKEYATATVRRELNTLQESLQENLNEQQKLLSDTPEVTKETVTRKESFFAFLGRLMHLEGGVLEFIMSTLSAVFVNLIAPLSLTATMELSKKQTIKT